ncbi:TetR/AcrR family transcriptional regulator [Actinomadura decatromicini]|uniref:TetR/AcrR family transcriptional regulator n=1 Tax=Actinomadura decatromicini TaxID=2604572 RepID=A0A5D3F5N7_9ACTN|nr:TetR/AcrR family transcriptional regulator [Actinomadura decatromicini]TYK44317.1 TetR/AcrR family transcriptional regulator [Actinomadura decatromicini]
MSPRNVGTNQRMRAEAKAKILACAHRLFREHGYDSTSLARIAREAGVSAGLTVYYFRTKHHLVQALADRLLHERVVRRIEALDPGAGPDERLATLVDAVLEAAAAEPQIIALHLALLLRPGIAETLADAEHEHEERLAVLAQEILASRGTDAVTEQLLFRTSMMGLVYGMVSPYQPLPLETARAHMYAQYGLAER